MYKEKILEGASDSIIYIIDNIVYMAHLKQYNVLVIIDGIFQIPHESYFCVKKNISNLLEEFNPQIKFSYIEEKDIKNLPDFVKDLLIL